MLLALAHDTVWMSVSTFTEIYEVRHRPRFERVITPHRRERLLTDLLTRARFITPATAVNDCRDPKHNKYLELAWAAAAELIIRGTGTSWPSTRGVGFGSLRLRRTLRKSARE